MPLEELFQGLVPLAAGMPFAGSGGRRSSLPGSLLFRALPLSEPRDMPLPISLSSPSFTNNDLIHAPVCSIEDDGSRFCSSPYRLLGRHRASNEFYDLVFVYVPKHEKVGTPFV